MSKQKDLEQFSAIDMATAAANGFRDGQRAAQSATAVERETIRAVFLRNGFTVKEGQTDLKPYVYAAAEELLSIARAAWQRTQSVWVPVSERLPDIAQEVIVNSDFDGITAGFLDSYGEWYSPNSDYKLTRVVAWQPLPAAPAQPAAQEGESK